jgi:hypothetical protein
MTGPWDDAEGYCRFCFKMIPLTVGAASKILIPHSTFSMARYSDDATPVRCKGTVPDNTITHYMDDPKAAFE